MKKQEAYDNQAAGSMEEKRTLDKERTRDPAKDNIDKQGFKR